MLKRHASQEVRGGEGEARAGAATVSRRRWRIGARALHTDTFLRSLPERQVWAPSKEPPREAPWEAPLLHDSAISEQT